MTVTSVTSSVEELQTDVDPDLLRGVSLDPWNMERCGFTRCEVSILLHVGFTGFLQGVDVSHSSKDVCMGGFGRNFERPEPGMFKLDHSLYQQCKQMSFFHSFLSHDWGTSRWLKIMYLGERSRSPRVKVPMEGGVKMPLIHVTVATLRSLMVIYNSRAAFVCSLLVTWCMKLAAKARPVCLRSVGSWSCFFLSTLWSLKH